MSELFVCNVCDDEPFKAPADRVGQALMSEHLQSEHGALAALAAAAVRRERVVGRRAATTDTTNRNEETT